MFRAVRDVPVPRRLLGMPHPMAQDSEVGGLAFPTFEHAGLLSYRSVAEGQRLLPCATVVADVVAAVAPAM